MNPSPQRFRKHLVAGSMVAAILAGGGVLAGTVAANAAGDTSSSTPSSAGSSAEKAPSGDQSKSQRSDETLLTGTDATKATAAALAKYPGASIERVETDSDGVYEAHIVTSDGQRLIVQMDKNFAVTGTDSHGGSRTPGA
jgi:uncharacterized membrane protein YkoI